MKIVATPVAQEFERIYSFKELFEKEGIYYCPDLANKPVYVMMRWPFKRALCFHTSNFLILDRDGDHGWHDLKFKRCKESITFTVTN